MLFLLVKPMEHVQCARTGTVKPGATSFRVIVDGKMSDHRSIRELSPRNAVHAANKNMARSRRPRKTLLGLFGSLRHQAAHFWSSSTV